MDLEEAERQKRLRKESSQKDKNVADDEMAEAERQKQDREEMLKQYNELEK